MSGILVGAILRVSALGNVGSRTPDERTYTAQASTLLREGVRGVRKLAAAYVNDPDRFYPPPSRIGYTGPIAALMWATGRSDALVGAWVSCLASIVGLGLVASIGVRFFDPWVGVVATFLTAVFPPDLVIARRAWTEAWVSCLTCALLYCACAIARGDRSRATALAFLAVGGVFALTKETSAIVWGLCIAWVVVCLRAQSVRLVSATVVTGLLAVGLVSWAIGGLSVLWDIQSRYSAFHTANPYAIDYQSGPPHWLLASFWIMSPWTFSLALAGLPAAPFIGTWRDRRTVGALSGFAAIFLVLPIVLPSWLNVRYASPAFGPLCLLAAAALCAGVGWLQARLPAAVAVRAGAAFCGVALIAMGIRDHRYFTRWFVATETADLSVRMVFDTAGLTGALPPLGHAQRERSPGEDARPTAEGLLNASLTLYQQKRFDEAIVAARRALALRPDYAEAHNNIAAAYAEKGMWDEAIQAAQEALRLKPDFELARNNLAWAMAEKEKARSRGARP